MSTPRAPDGPPPSNRRKVAPPKSPPPSARKKPSPPAAKRRPPPRQENTRPKRSARSAPSSRRRKDDSSSSSSDSDAEYGVKNPDAHNYSENKKRVLVKGKGKGKMNKSEHNDEPSKYNDYLGRRMSDVLRGEDNYVPAIHDLLYEEDLEQSEPEGCLSKIKYNWTKKANERKFGPRALLCVVAVAFLWLSSASACRFFINLFIPAPTYAEVEEQVVNLQLTISDQDTQYVACVDQAVQGCTTNFESQIEIENERTNQIQTQNQNTLFDENVVRETCNAAYEEAIETLEGLVTTGTQLPFFAGVGGCNQVLDQLGPQISAFEAVTLASESGEASNEVTNTLQDEIDARVAYDEAYERNVSLFYDQRAEELRNTLFNGTDFRAGIQAEQDRMRACLSATGLFINEEGVEIECPEGEDIGKQSAELYDNLEEEYDNLNNSVTDLLEDIEAVQEEIERLQDLAGQAGAAIDFGIVPEVSTAEMERRMREGLNELGISDEEIDAFIEAREAELNNSIAAAEAELVALEEDIARQQQEFIDNLTKEFEEGVPGVSPETQESINNAREAASDISSQVAGDLDAANGDVNNASGSTNFTNLLNATQVLFLQGLDKREISFFAYDDNVFFQVEQNLDQVISLLLLFDTVWRVLKSLLLVKKYWEISAIGTPPADVRSDKGMLFKEKDNVFQLIGKILTNPIVQMLYNIAVIFIISLLFYLAYSPLFNEFVNGCVENDNLAIKAGDATGTMLFRNINSMSVTTAAADGDRFITENVDTLNLERQLVCSRALQESVDVRQEQTQVFEDLQRQFNTLSARYNLFERCVDWEVLDADIDIALKFDPLFGEPECNRVMTEIVTSEEALHNCDNVEPCLHSCEVNIDLIDGTSHNTACQTEFALHSYFLVGLFVSTMFICLNLSRHYFLSGVIEVGWPYLTLDVYSYMISCTERGTIIPPEEVEEGDPFKDVIKEALDKSLRNFTVKGYLDLIFAFSINLPWIVFIAVFSQDVSYSPNQ